MRCTVQQLELVTYGKLELILLTCFGLCTLVPLLACLMFDVIDDGVY